MDKPSGEQMRLAQLRASASRGRGRGQGITTQGKVYHLNQEATKASTNMVANMSTGNALLWYVLFDHGVIPFFIACNFVNKLKE